MNAIDPIMPALTSLQRGEDHDLYFVLHRIGEEVFAAEEDIIHPDGSFAGLAEAMDAAQDGDSTVMVLKGNLAAGTFRDVTEDIAHEILRLLADGFEPGDTIPPFVRDNARPALVEELEEMAA